MAIGVHAMIAAGIVMLPGIELPDRLPTIVEGIHIPLAEPDPPKPEVQPEKPKVKLPQPKAKTTVKPMVTPSLFREVGANAYTNFGENIDLNGSGTGMDIPIEPMVIPDAGPAPVLVEPSLNGRFAANFQPRYPAGLLRLGEEGMVSVRVLVGINGRVKQIELISTPHDEFWAATKRHALKKWRFKPATSDGKPYESWMNLKVKFEINS